MNKLLALTVFVLAGTGLFGQDYAPATLGPVYHPALSTFQPSQSLRPNITASTTLGDFGEWLVQEDLHRQGYALQVHKRPGNQGMDLIATKPGAPVRIIEVKTRHSAWSLVGPDQLTEEGIRNRAKGMADPGSHPESRRMGRRILKRMKTGGSISYEAYKINIKQNEYRRYVMQGDGLVEVERGRLSQLLRRVEKHHPSRVTRLAARAHRHMFAVDRLVARGRLSPVLGRSAVWLDRKAAGTLRTLYPRRYVLRGGIRGPASFARLGEKYAGKIGPFLFMTWEGTELLSHWDNGGLSAVAGYGQGLFDPVSDTADSWMELHRNGFPRRALYAEILSTGAGLATGLAAGLMMGAAFWKTGTAVGFFVGGPFGSVALAAVGAVAGFSWGFLAGYRDGRQLGRLAAEKFFTESVTEDERDRTNDWIINTGFKDAYATLE